MIAEKCRDALRLMPKALSLFDRVVAHFGNSLMITECDPDGGDASVGFNGGARTLVVNTTLEPSSIVHEAEHVKLLADGFPLSVDPTGWNHALYRDARNLENHVSHLLFVQDFLDWGFSRDALVFNPAERIDIVRLEEDIDFCLAEGRTACARAVFNAKYFVEMVYRRIGLSDQMDDLLCTGRSRFTGFGDDALFMEEWLERGDFRASGRYANALNDLLARIGYGRVEFSRLVVSEGRIRCCPA